MAYTAEEEQEIHQLKEWWKENYKGIIVVLVLTLAVVYGWRYWQQYQITQARAISVQYEALIAGDYRKNQQDFEQFVQANRGSSYAIFALLERAKNAVNAHQFKQAMYLLEQALAEVQDNILKSVIALRLAEVQFQLKKYDDALASLHQVQGKAWQGQKLQLQANIEQATGQKEKAKLTFEQALEVSSPIEQPMIKVRLNNLE